MQLEPTPPAMSAALDRNTRRQGGLAALLALIAGYIDSYTLLNFKVYASFMSGNTTHTGLNAGQGRLAEAAHYLLPIPFFVLGAFIGTFLLHGSLRYPVRRVSGLAAVLLAVSFSATYLGAPAMWCGIILLTLAMGVMNTTLTHVGGQRINLGFITGDLNNIGRHLALAARSTPLSDSQAPWDTHWWRAAVLAGVWGTFLLGAVFAGAGMLWVGKWVLLPPTLALLVLAWRDNPAASVNQ